ncbi:MAG: hypothetical protein IPI51_22225 [Betaproteobacteria bacterium]|nr:hypothetical protein [Betaproteobacteria bacterium]
MNLAGFTEFGGTLNGPFEAYCIDVTEFIDTSSSYRLLSAAAYFGDANKVSALGKLISYAQGSNVLNTAGDQDMQSTALQLAIWNIVYDTDSAATAAPGRWAVQRRRDHLEKHGWWRLPGRPRSADSGAKLERGTFL